MPFSARNRARYIQQIQSENYDLLVIGGGITGAGIALDAIARGLKVCLIEKADFASGTSSRSTKLIHSWRCAQALLKRLVLFGSFGLLSLRGS